MKNFTTVAEVYDPSQPIGQRWTTVGDTQIPRLYHSVAFLTPNAEVLKLPLQVCLLQLPLYTFFASYVVQSCTDLKVGKLPGHHSMCLFGCYQPVAVTNL